MRLHPYVLPTTLAAVFLISACGEKNIRTTPKKDTPPDKSAQVKDDERGFDPCLLNAKLAVCTNNETANSK